MNYPNIQNHLTGWPPIFIVGASPAMDEIPNVYASLDSVYTCAINRAWCSKPGPDQDVLFNPTWWIVTDRKPLDGDAEDPTPLVSRDIAWEYLGIRLWHWGSAASFHPDMPAVPWHHISDEGFETERLDRIRQYKTSDHYAMQILGGIMGARCFYLVGVDHTSHGDVFHSAGEVRRGHQPPDRNGRHGIGDGYREVKKWMKATGAKVYTCSPWEDSYTREFFDYISFDDAVKHAHREMANQ